MLETVTIARNAVTAKLKDPSREVKLKVQQILSYMVAGAENTPRYKASAWDGRSSFFDFRSCTFPAGFVPLVVAKLQREGHKINLVRKPLPEPLGIVGARVDSFPDDPRYSYQPEIVEKVVKHGAMIAQVATGGGKCLGFNTPVLMFDGTIKKVQDIDVGDLLMGPDSKPRRVLSLARGREEMFKVTPVKGEAYEVNRSHILSLRMSNTGEVVNVSIDDYFAKTKDFRRLAKGWRTGVEFAEQDQPIDPYILGVWLGDGDSRDPAITNADHEVLDYFKSWAISVGDKFTSRPDKNCERVSVYNPEHSEPSVLRVALRGLNLFCNKHIPHIYKTGSRKQRMELLAGIIDTDGCEQHGGYDIVLKQETLANDVAFVARSLGLAAYVKQCEKGIKSTGFKGEYFRVSISGDCSELPVKVLRKKCEPRKQIKNVLNTGITVESIGEGDYYGFEIDGDHLFLLGDFTVTHNTRVAKLLYARVRRPTLFLTTRSLLMYQMKDSFEKDMGVECSVLGDGQFGSVNAAGQMTIKPMCVGMVQTLTARLTVKTLPQQFEEIYDSLIAAEEKEVAAFKRKHKALDPKKLAHAVEELVKRQKSARATAEQIKKEAVKRIAVQQALHDQTIALLSKFECVIMEEAHEASGNSYYDIMRHCVNAHYRLALTATPFMKEDEEANMRLMACCGPVGYRVTEKQLIDAGILAKPFFKYVTIKNRPPKLYRHTGWQAAYRLGVVECKERNELVVAEAVKAHRYGLSVMALVQHTAHGDLLKHMLTLAGLRVRFISGECDHATRKTALQELADKKIDVLIGTTILDVGVDVPATGMIILAGAGKAEVALRQRIGRGLRAKKSGPNVAFIVDFEDIFNDHLKVHYQQRHAIVAGTPGFAENIIPPGTDFDYAGLGFVPVI